MNRFISRREHKEVTTYHLFYERKGHPGSGLSFDCDANGVVDLAKLHANGRANYDLAAAGDPAYHAPVVETRVHRWVEPAVIRCDCGLEVSLDGFTNTCDCDRDYNMSGQLLADRSQWGEETGESVSDILAADADYWQERNDY